MKDVERAKLCTSATGRCWEEQRKRFFKCISFFCALISHPGSSLGSETLPLVSWEQAQTFNDGRQAFQALGALCLSRLSAFSEETHHHPDLHPIRAFEVSCLICVTACVTQHRACWLFSFLPCGFTHLVSQPDETGEAPL